MQINDFIGKKVWYDNHSGFVFGETEEHGSQMLLEVRGWGSIQNLFKDDKGNIDEKKAALFQDKVGEFIAAAIQEKMERENGR